MNQFLQGFIKGTFLPNKFKIDKRISHFSTLIISGQMQEKTQLKN